MNLSCPSPAPCPQHLPAGGQPTPLGVMWISWRVCPCCQQHLPISSSSLPAVDAFPAAPGLAWLLSSPHSAGEALLRLLHPCIPPRSARGRDLWAGLAKVHAVGERFAGLASPSTAQRGCRDGRETRRDLPGSKWGKLDPAHACTHHTLESGNSRAFHCSSPLHPPPVPSTPVSNARSFNFISLPSS